MTYSNDLDVGECLLDSECDQNAKCNVENMDCVCDDGYLGDGVACGEYFVCIWSVKLLKQDK